MKRHTGPIARDSRKGSGGFTLIEVAVATAIIGIGVAALFTAIAAGTRANDSGQKLTQAGFLAQEIREWTLRLPFSDPDPADAHNPSGPDGTNPQVFVDDLDDLMGVTFSPPRDGRGTAIPGMTGWSQTITLSWRNASDLKAVVAAGSSDAINVTVAIAYRGDQVLTTSWLVTRKP